jgi:hypothetical protein
LIYYRHEGVLMWGLQEAQVIALVTGVLALGVLVWRSTRPILRGGDPRLAHQNLTAR